MRNRIATRADVHPALRHRVFCLLALRPAIVQLTPPEQVLLTRCAVGRRHAVELGVAEGGSAYLTANAMSADGTLELVDPFFPGSLRLIGLHERIARRLLRDAAPTVVFHKLLSWDAVDRRQRDPIDLLFIDGDHSEAGVRRDWEAWSPFLADGAIVLLHDAVDPATGAPGPVGPGLLLADLLESGWTLVDNAGVLAAIASSTAS